MSALELLLADRTLRLQNIGNGATFVPAPGDTVAPIAGLKMQSGVIDLTYSGDPGDFSFNLPVAFPNGILAVLATPVTLDSIFPCYITAVGAPSSDLGTVSFQCFGPDGIPLTTPFAISFLVIGY